MSESGLVACVERSLHALKFAMNSQVLGLCDMHTVRAVCLSLPAALPPCLLSPASQPQGCLQQPGIPAPQALPALTVLPSLFRTPRRAALKRWASTWTRSLCGT